MQLQALMNSEIKNEEFIYQLGYSQLLKMDSVPYSTLCLQILAIWPLCPDLSINLFLFQNEFYIRSYFHVENVNCVNIIVSKIAGYIALVREKKTCTEFGRILL